MKTVINHKITKNKILTFKQFNERIPFGSVKVEAPRYRNFFLRFIEIGHVAKFIRKETYMVRFQKEHPTLDRTLCEKVTKLMKYKDRSKALKQVDKELYKAYRILKSYGISDKDLFA